MRFSVFAGNMFVGKLDIVDVSVFQNVLVRRSVRATYPMFKDNVHAFTNREGLLNPDKRIINYKHLNLKRTL